MNKSPFRRCNAPNTPHSAKSPGRPRSFDDMMSSTATKRWHVATTRIKLADVKLDRSNSISLSLIARRSAFDRRMISDLRNDW